MTTEPIESDPIPLTVPEAVTEAAHVLAALGLVTAFGHVSARLDTECVVVRPPRPLGGVRAADLIRVQLDAAALPFGAPPETWAHLAVYAARPDVAAVVRAMPPSAFAAALLARDRALRPQHGQGAWLGNAIPVHGLPRLLRTPALADAAARTLGPASAVVLRGNGALTTGPSPSVAVTRMWLLDAALCRVRIAAPAGAELAPEDVEPWQAAAPTLVDRLWEYLRSAPDDPLHPARRSPLA